MVVGVVTSDSVVRVVMAALDAGGSYRVAADLSGVSVRTVKRLVARYGLMSIRERVRRRGELSWEDREQIFAGIVAGDSDATIGVRLGRPRGTVWREIDRNGGREKYRPLFAEERACDAALRGRGPWFVEREWLWEAVQGLLRLWWSPRQISCWLKKAHAGDPQWWVSHESIYQAIYVQAKGTLKTELVACLRQQRSQRKPQGRAKRGAGSSIKNMVSISQRPPEIEDRALPGHWEGDLIVGKANGSAIATIVERSTRFGFMVRLDSKNAEHVATRIAEEATKIPAELFRSLTWDQGTEMAAHADLAAAANIDVFFCDPASPWQRGTNENWNGLARQYFPKGTDLSVHTQADLDAAAHSLNTRPRETLDWDNPAIRFNQLVATTN